MNLTSPAIRTYGEPDLVDVVLACFQSYIASPAECDRQLPGLQTGSRYVLDAQGRVTLPAGKRDALQSIVLGFAAGFHGHFDPACLMRAAEFAECVARDRFGGARSRIRKRETQWARAQRVKAQLLRGQSSPGGIDALFARAGVSRATGYRILKSKKR